MPKNITAIGFVLSTAVFVCVTVGCTSFRSTIVDRQEDDSLAVQPCPSDVRGIPVKLKIPSHLEVKIVETFYLDGDGRLETMLVDSETKRKLLEVNQQLIYTDKVFLVDFPRPLAGTLNLGASDKDGLTFDSEQYFASIRAAYEEQTLSTVNEILGGSSEGQTKSTKALPLGPADDNKTPQIQKLSRVVAFERFDIAVPGWEAQMDAFVAQYLGDCEGGCFLAAPVAQPPKKQAATGGFVQPAASPYVIAE